MCTAHTHTVGVHTPAGSIHTLHDTVPGNVVHTYLQPTGTSTLEGLISQK